MLAFLCTIVTYAWLCSALHKAGTHMEDSIVAAYVALLVGCIIQHNSVSTVHQAGAHHPPTRLCATIRPSGNQLSIR